MATTATVTSATRSQAVDNRIGTITFWHKAKSFGTVTVDTTPPQQFFAHATNFPAEQRPFIAQGKTVQFSSRGGQEIGEGKKPRVSKAKLLKD
jgi:cold shock CspA family protein